MTVREALNLAAGRLSAVTDEAKLESGLMLAHIMGMKKLSFGSLGETLREESLEELDEMIFRRLSREPLQYILGETYFMGLRFETAPFALIPRQDTETLCEEALRLIGERGYRTLLDVCTGTGCIAVSLAKLSGICAEASDISPDCAALASKNAGLNGVFMSVRTADLFEGAGSYDIITANPPYIPDPDIPSLQEEVKREPMLALRGGPDGLSFYRRIADSALSHLNSGGALLLEVGIGEAEAVSALFPGTKARILKDLNGTDRVLVIEL